MNTEALGLGLAALSALSTAFAHAMVKAGGDKLAIQAWVRLTGLALALPLIVVSPLPDAQLLLWLLLAAAAHATYQALLVGSYHLNDFAAAFPIARGTGLLLTAGGGLLLLGEAVPPGQVFGIALISVGILAIARLGRMGRAGMALAIATGVLTATYSLIDAHAMRMAPSVAAFLGWFYLFDAIAMPVLFCLRRPAGSRAAMLRAERRAGTLAGIGSLAAFVPALIAYRYAPAGVVNALRETSILLALVAGRIWLGERPGGWHWIAAAAIAGGAVVIVAAA
ncbi:EamA family transporter [Qipengyuania sediminis]|uniref:EamA family transporter n=1 Tax=Qipengyuania sediminis TaxID=1532023 RepID=UPI00105989E8|nr:EamA family transporter [Qipengyuania sediminis]